jgi:hypothetical protein
LPEEVVFPVVRRGDLGIPRPCRLNPVVGHLNALLEARAEHFQHLGILLSGNEPFPKQGAAEGKILARVPLDLEALTDLVRSAKPQRPRNLAELFVVNVTQS